MNKSFLILLLVASLSSSCITMKQLKKSPDETSKQLPAERITGIYHNSGKGSKTSLWDLLIYSKSINYTGEKTIPKTAVIKLELSSEGILTATAYRNIKQIAVVKFKGKVRDDYFYPKRKFFLIPFAPFYYKQRESRISIRKNTAGKLLLEAGRETSVMIFKPSGQSEKSSHSFREANGW